MKQQSTLLNDLVKRVCQVVHPLRIALFGSAVDLLSYCQRRVSVLRAGILGTRIHPTTRRCFT